jgi:hypothetical protein
MSSGPSAPPPSPMLSPDHKWVWDGSEWQPIADPNDPARKGVFAAFTSAAQDLPAPVATARPVAVQAAPVGLPYSVNKPKSRRGKSAQPSPLLWEQPKTGLHKYLYIVAGAVAALIVVLLALQYLQISLPWTTASTSQPTPASAPPLTDRSDFARADRFLTGIVAPAVTRLDDVMGPVKEGCNGLLTLTCEYAVPPAQRQAKNLLAVISAATVPDCIGSSFARIKADATGINGGLVSMQAGYDHNSVADMKNGLARLMSSRQALTLDVAAAGKAQAAGCDRTVTGP